MEDMLKIDGWPYLVELQECENVQIIRAYAFNIKAHGNGSLKNPYIFHTYIDMILLNRAFDKNSGIEGQCKDNYAKKSFYPNLLPYLQDKDKRHYGSKTLAIPDLAFI